MESGWLASAVVLTALAATAGRSPDFARYPAEAALVGSPTTPSLASAKPRKFRTHLRDAAAEGVNFNGHYKVTHWGQGTNVIEWAVIDLQTGAVWFAPDVVGSCWGRDSPDDPTEEVDWTESHADSALLYLHECRGGIAGGRTFDTRRVYVWESGAPRLLRTEPLPLTRTR